MIFILVICGALPVITWFVAEIKGKLGLRLLVGFFAFGVVGMLSFVGGRTKPEYENEDMRACLAEIQVAIQKGDLKRVEAGYREYATDIAEGRDEYHSQQFMLMAMRAYKP